VLLDGERGTLWSIPERKGLGGRRIVSRLREAAPVGERLESHQSDERRRGATKFMTTLTPGKMFESSYLSYARINCIEQGSAIFSIFDDTNNNA